MPSSPAFLTISTDPRRAARALLAGGLVGLPTETVYGLAALATDNQAVARVYAVKGRPADHPLIVHLGSSSALAVWARIVPAYARDLAEALWPGPLTLVLARSDRAGDHITGGQDTVALRVPAHPVALAVLSALDLLDPAGAPHGIAAPSANRFGRVSPTTAAHVVAELAGRLDPRRDLVLDGGPAQVGVESTILDCTGSQPVLLRPGAVHAATVLRVTGLRLAAPGPSSATRAPGTLPSHYAPRARVVLAEQAEVAVGALADERAADDPAEGTAVGAEARGTAVGVEAGRNAVGVEAGRSTVGVEAGRSTVGTIGLLALASVATPEGIVRLSAPADAESYARGLYASLREADALGLSTVIAIPPPSTGIGAAVRDRLRRAAADQPPPADPT